MRTPPCLLVVDDEPTNVDILRTRLTVQGYDVLTAVDGPSALALATTAQPDLILLDIRLPTMDGPTVCRALKADTTLPFIPIILLTAKTDPREVVAGVDAEAQEQAMQAAQWAAWSRTLEQRLQGQITALERLGGLKKTIRALGNAVLPGFTASKILWLKKREPKNYHRLDTILLPHDYLNFWLTGEKVMEPGDASGTALLDVRNRKWSNPALDAIDPELADKLPPLIRSDQPAGRLLSSTAKSLDLSSDVLVSAGGGDNMMGAIGTGNTRAGLYAEGHHANSGIEYTEWRAEDVGGGPPAAVIRRRLMLLGVGR